MSVEVPGEAEFTRFKITELGKVVPLYDDIAAGLDLREAVDAMQVADEIRFITTALAVADEIKLRTHDHDRGVAGWRRCKPADLRHWLNLEMQELNALPLNGDYDQAALRNVLGELADIRNYCTMIADVLLGGVTPERVLELLGALLPAPDGAHNG